VQFIARGDAGQDRRAALVKKGEANINRPLRNSSRPTLRSWIVSRNASAITERTRSPGDHDAPAVEAVERGRRRSAPASRMPTARESITPPTASPEWVCCITSAKTAMLLKLSPTSLHHLRHPRGAVVAVRAE